MMNMELEFWEFDEILGKSLIGPQIEVVICLAVSFEHRVLDSNV